MNLELGGQAWRGALPSQITHEVKDLYFDTMKCRAFVSAVTVIISLMHLSGLYGLSDSEEMSSISPSTRFEIILTVLPEDQHWIEIKDHGHRIAHYCFSGEMRGVYWSPHEQYVAINNHNGHRAWYPWIISLSDGAVITAGGRVTSPDYDRYTDENDLPNISALAQGVLQRLNPNLPSDKMRDGYISIAYKWSAEGNLAMFYEFTYDKLSSDEDSIIWIKATLEVRGTKIDVADLRGEKVKSPWWDKYPPEIKTIIQ